MPLSAKSASAKPIDPNASFDFKSGSFTLVVFTLFSSNLREIEQQLHQKLDKMPGFFDHEPLVFDLQPIADDTTLLDFKALSRLVRKFQLVPVGVRHGSETQTQAAQQAGLGHFPDHKEVARPSRETPSTPEPQQPELPLNLPQQSQPEPEPETVIQEVYRPAKVVDKPVRSGQQIYAKGADLIIMASVAAGAEVLADGNVHVYGVLRGRAHAGVAGDEGARIITRQMEAEMISVAGVYRMLDAVAKDSVGPAAQVYLSGEKLIIAPLGDA